MLNIPPLREREGDVELLSKFFLERYCRRNNLPVQEMTPEAQRLFRENQWPGNVRELENAIIYAVNMSRGKTINAGHVSEDIHKGTLGFRGAQNSRRSVLAKEKAIETLPSLEELEALM
jgi:DNA-binding NtrC family response regulator